MIKKIILVILVISFILCVGFKSKKTDNSPVTIQFSSWGSESEVKILKPLLENFEKENPDIKVDFMHIPQNYFQKLHLLFASNTAPDVIFINNQYLPVYANAGLLVDLTNDEEYFEYDKYFSKVLASLKWDGKIYAVARDVSNLVVFYNKDLFKKYNVHFPKSDWDFEDFLQTAKKLTHKPDVFGISFEENPLFYMPYVMSEGFEGVAEFEAIKENSGLKFYSDLRKKYHVAPMRDESASATMAQMFLQEKLAMHLSGRWLVPIYRTDAKFDWDIAPFPSGKVGSVVPLDSSGWAIANSSKHKSEAKRLVKYLSSKVCSQKFAKSGLIVPARIDSANSPDFLDNQKPQNSKIFIDIIEKSQPTPVTVNYRQVLDELKTKTETLFNP